MQDYKEIQFKNQTIKVSHHAIERMLERFDRYFNLEFAIGRGKVLTDQNVCKWPWLRKKLFNNLNSAVKFIVNPYYNFQAVVENGILITVEYLDASHTEYGRKYYSHS